MGGGSYKRTAGFVKDQFRARSADGPDRADGGPRPAVTTPCRRKPCRQSPGAKRSSSAPYRHPCRRTFRVNVVASSLPRTGSAAGRRSAPTAAWAPDHRARCRACAAPRRRTSARRESVVDLHLGFINAGAELIETNTFGANRRKLATHFLEQELEQINSAGVKLARDAREVSGRDVYIAGSIGPLGDVGDAEDERLGAFAEQAARARGPRRRPLHGRDVLRPRRARRRRSRRYAASRRSRSSRC